MDKNDKSVEQFWQDFEKQTGEKVVAKTMGQSFASPSDRGDWGLLVLSPTSLRFRKTPGENWFATLFKAAKPQVPENLEDDLVIPFSEITSIISPQKKFLDFLFGSPFFTFTVEYTQVGVAKSIRFAVDTKNDFFAELQKLTGRTSTN
jgi:hypothetical protein